MVDPLPMSHLLMILRHHRVFRLSFVMALAVMTILPIGIHTLMLDQLGIPYPAALPRTGWVTYPDHVLQMVGLVGLQAYLRCHGMSAVRKGAFLFLVTGAINQALFRLPVMRNVVSTKWTIYPFVDNLPVVLWFAAATALVIIVGPLTTTVLRKLGAAAVIAVILDRIVAPKVAAKFASVIAANGRREGNQLYNIPYDWHVNVPSYLTYAEPALAALATALVLRRLRAGPGAIGGLLFALQAGPLFRVVLNIWYAPLNPPMAMLSEGQFTLEAVTLAALAAAAAVVLNNDRPRDRGLFTSPSTRKPER